MLDRLRSLLTVPSFQDEEVARLASLFNVVLLVTFGVALLASLGILFFIPEQIQRLVVMLFVLPLIVAILYLIRQGRVYLAIKIYTVLLWIILVLLTMLFGGITTPAFTSFIIVILMAGMLWSGRAGIFFASITVGFGFIVAVADLVGIMQAPVLPTTPFVTWIGQTANFFLIAFFLYQTRESLNKALNKAREEVSIRTRVENALRQGEMQLRHVLDTVPESVLLLDNNGRINLANPVAQKHLAILAPNRKKDVLTRLGDHSLEALFTSPPKGLWHEVKSEGAIFEAIAHPVESTSQNLGWVMVLRDVTQERVIQRQIQQQERLAAVGELAAGIAHDFNNIIAVIILYAQMLAHQSQITPYMKDKLDTIQQQGHRAADLIQQILDFSRQSVLDQRPLLVVPFLQQMVKLFGRTLRENIDIQLNHGDHFPTIFVDPSRIQQVLMNLAVNARDAMPSGGRLTISLDEIELAKKETPPVQGMAPGPWVVINFSDTGFGMSPQTISRIYEPFFSTKEVGKGTGLGLSQVYGIMKQHEGYLEVQSVVNEGTTFSLYFPGYRREQVDESGQELVQVPFGEGQAVLLVEDNLATRNVLAESLTTLNYQVVEAKNGREALTILSQDSHRIDAVISDAVMPEMGGVALLRTLRERNIDIPIIILTGHPLTGELDSLREEGLDDWMLKPPTLEALAGRLEKLLKK